MTPMDWAAALETTALGQWMRVDPWAYPVANVLHLLGLAALVGPMLLLDLRLLGLGRVFPLRAASRVLTGWAMAGLALAVGSGIALFSADAGVLAGNRVMQLKLALLAVALANAALFRWRWPRHADRWDTHAPVSGRVQALLSMLLWVSVPVAGRMIAYV